MDVRYGCCWNVKDINLVYIGDLIYNVIWKEYVIRIDNQCIQWDKFLGIKCLYDYFDSDILFVGGFVRIYIYVYNWSFFVDISLLEKNDWIF